MNTAFKNNDYTVKTVYLITGLALFAAIFAVSGEARPFFFDIDEPKYITAALEMARNGDWWHPMFGGLPRMEKPPLPYWLAAPLLKWLGTNFSTATLLFIARIPAVISSILCVLGTYFIGTRLFSRRTALFAALFLAICPAFKLEGLMLKADIIYTAAVTWASYFYLRRFQGDKSFLNLAAATLALMFGVLAKGPFALPAIAGYLMAELLRFKRENNLSAALGKTLKAQCLPILMGAIIGCGPFLFWLFSTGTGGMNYSSGMFANLFKNSFYHGNPFLFYLQSLGFYLYETVLVFFPLGGFALGAIYLLITDKESRFKEGNFVLWTCIFYLLLCLVLFRLRAHRYFLPILPFLSLVTVNWIMKADKTVYARKLRALGGLIAAGTAFICAGLIVSSGRISVNLWKNFKVADFYTQLLPFVIGIIIVGIVIAAVVLRKTSKPKLILSVLFIATLALYPLYFNAAPGFDAKGNMLPTPLIGQELQKYFEKNIPENCLPVFTEHTANTNPDLYFFLRNHDGLSGKGYPAKIKFNTSDFNNLLINTYIARDSLKKDKGFSPQWPLFKVLSATSYKKAVLILSGEEFTQLYRNSLFLNQAIGAPAKFVPIQGTNISWEDGLLYVVQIPML